ncbi:LPS export ABC transporter periplasmic protein LptC [Limnohabitans sp.]|uniref:LPS export ABC transporter periplasmic protein LptC n=1 Tax=Limnohabitans sp. TaxID=1907725 RepID=UPI00333E2FB1
MSAAEGLNLWTKLRRWLDRFAAYLPILLMGLMAMTTYWLLRNAPVIPEATSELAPRHVPDYFMHDFSVKVFGADGRLKSEVVGKEGRHFPDTDTLEIDEPRIRILNTDGRLTTAVAKRGLINADGSEAQLFEKAVVVREATTNKQGTSVPRTELQSDFLHLFSNTEEVRSHLPVVLVQGAGNRFTGDGLSYDNLAQVIQLTGRVRGTLPPRQDKEKK